MKNDRQSIEQKEQSIENNKKRKADQITPESINHEDIKTSDNSDNLLDKLETKKLKLNQELRIIPEGKVLIDMNSSNLNKTASQDSADRKDTISSFKSDQKHDSPTSNKFQESLDLSKASSKEKIEEKNAPAIKLSNNDVVSEQQVQQGNSLDEITPTQQSKPNLSQYVNPLVSITDNKNEIEIDKPNVQVLADQQYQIDVQESILETVDQVGQVIKPKYDHSDAREIYEDQDSSGDIYNKIYETIAPSSSVTAAIENACSHFIEQENFNEYKAIAVLEAIYDVLHRIAVQHTIRYTRYICDYNDDQLFKVVLNRFYHAFGDEPYGKYLRYIREVYGDI